MKNKLLLFGLFISSLSFGQRVAFSYDSAGNQIRRYICVTCSAKNSNVNQSNTIADKDLLTDSETNLLYFPNPVKEELFVKWTNKEIATVESINLFSMTGQVIWSKKDLNFTNDATVNFQGYPLGYYNLELIYTNGDKKTLKIIKL